MSLRRGAAVGRTLAVGLVLAAALAVPMRAQQQIPIGTSVTGQLTQFDPVMTDQTHYKVFTFTGTAGQTVQIDLMSADFDAYLYLKDQNGNSIAHDDDSGGGRNARIIQVLPYTGLYQIYANTVGRGETGAFTLQLRSGGETSQMATAGSGMAQQIPIGTSVQGELTQSDPTLSDGSHYKMFTFMGTAGQTVQIDLVSSAFDSYLYLRNSSGQAIAHDDDSGGGLNARIVQTLPYTGLYQILANTLASGQFGAFTLQLQIAGQGMQQVTQPTVSAIPSVTSLPLTGNIGVNQQIQNTLYAGGVSWNSKPIQLYGYQCTAGQVAQIDVLGTWDNYLIVFDPNGVEVAHDDDSGGSLQARLSFSCPSTGTYRLGVTTALASTSPGAYTLRVQQLQGGAAQTVGPTAIASATSLPLTGNIGVNQQVQNTLYAGGATWNSKPIQVYGYQCTAGQLAQIDVLGSWDNYLIVFDPNGVEVAHDDDSGGSLQARLMFACPTSGLYRLGVTTALAGTSPGAYTLRIQQMQATTGQVTSITPTAPQPVTPAQPVTVTPLPVQPTVTQPAAVGAPTNMIPAPGQPGSIMIGQSVQGRLEPGDQTMGSDSTYADIWQFQGTGGQAIAIQLSSHDFPTYLQLLDGAGNVLQESAGHPDSGLAFTLPSTGTYQIVVNSNGRQRRTGLYVLTLR